MSEHAGQYDHEHAQSNHAQSNHAERTHALYATVTDVLDTVASFDGRFSFTPVDPGGHAVLSFAARDERLDLAVDVTYNAAADHVRVTLAQDPAAQATATTAQDVTPGEVRAAPAHSPDTDTNAAAAPEDSAPASAPFVAYEGSRSATAIHYQLGAALAKWYGDVVRSQFGPTLGEDES